MTDYRTNEWRDTLSLAAPMPIVTAMDFSDSPTPAAMRIRGSTELLFVAANPVAQVKAPEVFNHVFSRAGVDAVVVPARVASANLGGFVREALAVGNVRGLLVSIPHKTPLMQLLARFDAVAQAAGAVNAVRRGTDGALEGALFDGAGFVGALRHHGVDCTGRRVLLVGAGGAGLAIAAALAALPLAELAVFDASADRAAALVERIAPLAGHPLRIAPSADPAGFDLLIQATPLGLKAGDPLPIDAARIDARSTLVDILMTREPSPLQRACFERGISAFSGHEMLIQQVPAYLDFFGWRELAAALREPGSTLMDEVRRLMRSPPDGP